MLLYELVTGTTPFDQSRLRKAALDEAVRIIRDEEPPRPSVRLSSIATLASVAAQRRVEPTRLRTLVRGELDWIVMKSLDKERTRRYQTSAALADDIQRYITDQRVIAHPPTPGYLMQKFVRRNRIAISVASVLLVTFLAGFAGTVFGLIEKTRLSLMLQRSNIDLDEKKSNLQTKSSELQESNETLRRERYVSDMTSAQAAYERGEYDLALQLLDRNKPKPNQQDLRGIEWDYLWNLLHEFDAAEIVEFKSNTTGLAVSASGKYLAVAQVDGVISVLNTDTRQRAIPDIRGGDTTGGWGSRVAFSARGERLAYVEEDNLHISLLDLESGARVRNAAKANPHLDFALSVKEDIIAVMSKNKIDLHSLKDGTLVRSASTDKPTTGGLVFTPDGKFLLGGGLIGELRAWKLDQLDQPIEFEGHTEMTRALATSPDGKIVVTGGYDSNVII